MADTDNKIDQIVEDSWIAKLEELDNDQFLAFLEEFSNNTKAPSLKAALKVAAARLRKGLTLSRSTGYP